MSTGDAAPQGLSFGSAAEAYDRTRPSYPREALDRLLPRGASRALDLGAGTGKLTRLLLERGLDVVAVEPDAGMREHLTRLLPGARALAGTAEDLPLADASVDVALAGQVWHWVDPAAAVPEVARVLVPGGRLGVLTNLRDESVPWVAALGELLRREAPVPTDRGAEEPVVGPPFGPLRRAEVRWTSEVQPEGVVELVTSRSSVIRMAPGQREALLGEVRSLFVEHLGEGMGPVALPYLTTVWWADLS